MCDTEVDLCYSHPCQHGGTCFQRESGYTCLCPSNYAGKAAVLSVWHRIGKYRVCHLTCPCLVFLRGRLSCIHQDPILFLIATDISLGQGSQQRYGVNCQSWHLHRVMVTGMSFPLLPQIKMAQIKTQNGIILRSPIAAVWQLVLKQQPLDDVFIGEALL